jgi:hypothetical protein
MIVTPLAIHGVSLFEAQVFRNRPRFFFGSFTRKNVTLVATMRRNTNITVSSTIRLSASRSPSTASRTVQLFCVGQWRAEAAGNYASELAGHADKFCE